MASSSDDAARPDDAATPAAEESSAGSQRAGAEQSAAGQPGEAQDSASGHDQATATKPAADEPDSEAGLGNDIDQLINQAAAALESVDNPRDAVPHGAVPYKLTELSPEGNAADKTSLDLLSEVELDVRIELGRTEMELEELLRLGKGSVVPLDKLAGDPVDVFVNGRLIARGEILVLNDSFCVRVAELVSSEA